MESPGGRALPAHRPVVQRHARDDVLLRDQQGDELLDARGVPKDVVNGIQEAAEGLQPDSATWPTSAKLAKVRLARFCFMREVLVLNH